MKRTIYEADHHDLRASYAAFLTREVEPVYAQWEQDGADEKSAALAVTTLH